MGRLDRGASEKGSLQANGGRMAAIALDSGVQWAGAHRFCFREGLRIPSFCFRKEVAMRGGRIACALVLAVWALLSARTVLADDENRFWSEDWELVCDNTRACSAVGYQVENSDSKPVSLFIGRDAGPNTPLQMILKVGGFAQGYPAKETFRLEVGKAVFARLAGLGNNGDPNGYGYSQMIYISPPSGHLMPDLDDLMPELLANRQALVSTADGRRWELSLAGLPKVLLKMDELQGRLDTPGALVKRGEKPESSVLPPLPMPEVKVAVPVATQPKDKLKVATLISPLLDWSAYKVLGCGDDYNVKIIQKYAKDFVRVNRLDEHRLLLSVTCSAKSRYLLWIVSDEPPYAPHLLDIDGLFHEDDMSLFDSSAVGTSRDCGGYRDYHFDGENFVLTYAAIPPRSCRASYWSLPIYRAEVIPAQLSVSP
jgi:hypothetical protein